MTDPHSAKHAGFSLVELSIVLVILGLLVGGILGGQSLIRAAQLRSLTTDIDKYRTAVFTFRDKYFAIPGDMSNAESFWGTMTSGTCPNATGGTGTQTCNGNGNGAIVAGASAAQTSEMFMFWQHLANAGLIAGNYTGINGGSAGSYMQIVGVNVPPARVSPAGFDAWHLGDVTTALGTYYVGNYGNIFAVGIYQGSAGLQNGGFLKAEEMWGIDKKVDDGLPGQGTLVSYAKTFRANCATTDSATTAVYDLSNSSSGSTACSIIVKMGL